MRSPKPSTPLLLTLGLVAISSSSLLAQTGEYHNSKETINGSFASSFTTFAIGPNADITVNGDWYITANTVTIDSAAKIGGTGTLHLMTPKTYGATAAATTLTAGGIMGNSAGITCKVSLENGSGIVLAGTHNLVMGNNLAFAKVGAHLTLGATAGLVFTNAATAFPTIANVPAAPSFARQDENNTTFADAYVVTNGAGSVSKAGLANADAFTFPIGFSRSSGAATDYTPAAVTNNAAPRDIQARVAHGQDYTNSAPVERKAASGINRTWQIQGSAAGNATVALTHNTVTEGTDYARNAALVTQNTTAGGWSVNTPTTSIASNHTNTGTFNIPVGADGASFSKSSHAVSSTPVNLLTFAVTKAGANRSLISWETASEEATSYFEIERSLSGRENSYRVIGLRTPAAHNSTSEVSYQAYDEQPAIGTNYYRLKVVDISGKVAYSDSRVIRCDNLGARESITLFPNPVRTEDAGVNLKVTVLTAQTLDYTLTDITGKILITGKIAVSTDGSTYKVPGFESIVPGTYFLRVKGTTLSESIKVLKIN